MKFEVKKADYASEQQIIKLLDEHAFAQKKHYGFGRPDIISCIIDDKLIAAAEVMTFWGGVHLKYCYVDENFRNQKIGTKLIEQVALYATKNNCNFIFLETMSFQAAGFYKKLGFEEEFIRNHHSHNCKMYYMRKEL